ncbi:MAG: hypothetical protein HZA17_14995 [Nitrospirae bacterium]|nr:hypothetical protein [Nitrospirota bacterium]
MKASEHYCCTMTSCAGQETDIWSYREATGSAAMEAMVFAASVFGLAVLLVGSSLKEKLPFILLFLVIGVLLLWSSKRVTTIVISRKDGSIRKEERSLIFSRSRRYPLYDFNDLTVHEQLQAGEEGYPLAVCSLVLQGPLQTLTLISTNDRAEAERIRNDLASYLGFTAGSPSAESERAVLK